MANILLDAFNLPPEDAIKFLEQKGYQITFDWHDMLDEAHARAFTVAKAMRLDILKDIRDELDKALKQGLTYREFKKQIEPKLKAKGWWGKQPVIDPKTGEEKLAWLGTPWRLKTIFNQNTQSAYMAGRYRQMKSVAKKRPYWQYLAVMDSRTRPTHAALHGKVFRADDPFWDSFYPPNGWNCRCHVRSLSKNQLKNYGLEDRVESSDGKLFSEDRLISKKTGEFAEVKVYKDGKIKISPDVGFSYTPGKAPWRPNLDKYDFDSAFKFLKEFVNGPDFERFFNQKSKGKVPVGVLKQNLKEAIGAKSQTVNLSNSSLAKNLEHHPELVFDEYKKLPDIIADAHLVIQDKERTLVFYQVGDKILYAVVKATKSGKALFLTSFRLASHTDVAKLKKKGKVILDKLK